MSVKSSRKITILYGSQTGNAQDVAERIWRDSKRFYFTGSVKAMDDYNITELICERLVIFVCSTTGQGDEPDNMKTFWKFLLRKTLPTNSLMNLKFAVLGLGDSSYVKFNFVAKRLHKRLMQLGAEMIMPLALGDDQHDLGFDGIVDPWIKDFWQTLLEIYPIPNKLKPLDITVVVKPRYKVTEITDKQSDELVKSKSIYLSENVKVPAEQFWVVVKGNIRTTSPTHFQDVRLIKFSTQGQQYTPGDVLNIRPKNSISQINEFYEILKSNEVNINPNTVYKISEIDPAMPVPLYLKNEITFQTLCEEYFDLNSIPRRYVFEVLALLTSSEIEKEKCIEFTTAEGQNDLYNYCNRPRRNITEVLADFPHAVKNLKIETMFEIFPPIKSRAFSIASSAKAHKKEIDILVAVVRYKTKLVKERLGLCSNWLAGLNVGDEVPVWIKKGSFRFPKKEDTPVIMVGPGTGVAPFRSYISEINHMISGATFHKLILFFGCRQEEHDFHFKEEFKKFENNRKLILICAFSRDQEDKIYVQHKIEEYGEKLWKLIHSKSASIFVAGNSKNMPQSVREAFINLCIKYNEMSEDDAEAYISLLEKNGQYQTETWY